MDLNPIELDGLNEKQIKAICGRAFSVLEQAMNELEINEDLVI